MKNRSRILSLSLASLALAACATTGEQASYIAPEPVGERVAVSIQPDEAYVSRVEMMARRQGADVRWINVPTKRVVATNQ